MTTCPDPATIARESRLELLLWTQIEQACLELPEWQYQVDGIGHKWDFAYPDLHILIECQGGTRGLGRHSREPGYSQDRARANRATLDGWRVLEFTSAMLNDGSALADVRDALEAHR